MVRLLVGLGNPGPEYDGTRHNVGFEVVDRVAEQLGRSFHAKGRSLLAEGEAGGCRFVLAKPQTYMNRSGRAVRDLLRSDWGPEARILVCCDDFHLELGRLRCRAKGSAGGQKGLDDILEHVPDRDVARLRLGIGDPGRAPAEEFVLRPFKRGEQADVDDMLERAAQAARDWVERADLKDLMARVNADGGRG